MDLSKIPPEMLATIPAAQPPNGVTPNFSNRPLAPVIIAICIICIVLQTAFLYVRVSANLGTHKKLFIDDWCGIAGAVISFGISVCLILNRDLGRHTWDVSIAEAIDPTFAKQIFAEQLMLGPAIFLGKCSLLLLYLRLFGRAGYVKWQIYFGVLLSLTNVALTPLDAIMCSPPNGAPWGTPNPRCIDTFTYNVVQGVMNLVVDVLIFYLPIPVILNLHLPARKRCGILTIFLTGLIAIVADCIIMKYRVEMYRQIDLNWAGRVVVLCSVVETFISIICSSMPSVAAFSKNHVLASNLFQSLRSRFTSSAGRTEPKVSTGGLSGYSSKSAASAPKRRGPYGITVTEHGDEDVAHLTDRSYIQLQEQGSFREPKKTNNMV